MQHFSMLIALVAIFATANGQFLQRRDGGNEGSMSWTSRSSWFQGRDGQMHKETQETRDDIVQDESGMKIQHTKQICKDGACTTVVVQEMPSVQQRPVLNEPCGHSSRMPLPLQQLFERLRAMQAPQNPEMTEITFERLPQPEMVSETVQQPEIVFDPQSGPVMILERRPQPQVVRQPLLEIVFERQPQPEIIFERFRKPALFSRPYDRFAAQKPKFDDRATIGDVIRAAEQQKIANAPPHRQWRPVGRHTAFVAGFVALIAMVTYAAVVAMAKCRISDAREAARERPFRDLAEPLVPGLMEETSMKAMQAAPAQDPEAAAVPAYLARVYSRANASVESTSVRKYMVQLYTRILS